MLIEICICFKNIIWERMYSEIVSLVHRSVWLEAKWMSFMVIIFGSTCYSPPYFIQTFVFRIRLTVFCKVDAKFFHYDVKSCRVVCLDHVNYSCICIDSTLHIDGFIHKLSILMWIACKLVFFCLSMTKSIPITTTVYEYTIIKDCNSKSTLICLNIGAA